jgi:hypothetical protein
MYVYLSREIVVSNLKNGNRTKVTPKLHFAEGHGPEALERHPDVLLLKKEWVERFHQREKSEEKVKFIPNIEKRVYAAGENNVGITQMSSTKYGTGRRGSQA